MNAPTNVRLFIDTEDLNELLVARLASLGVLDREKRYLLFKKPLR